MIKTRQDLKEYIKADESRYRTRKPRILGWILQDEHYRVMKFLCHLRYLEYYTNRPKTILTIVPYVYYNLRHRWDSAEYGLSLRPNVAGKGLYIPHLIGGCILNACKIGDYCTINSGVVLGNKGKQDARPIVGNNVEICIGAKVIGAVTIGDNAIIAPNTVVVKDVPANAVVSGVPAKLLKMKE